MKRISLLVLAFGLLGCGDDGPGDTAEVDGGQDAGVEVDMSTPEPDMFRVDMGGDADSCIPSGDDLTETVGCNGEPPGPDVADNDFGGACVGTAEDAGSCTFSGALCSATEGEMGYCLAFCDPDAGEYITTGDCPSGSRCFTLDTDLAICFPDCRSSADCRTGFECDEEGSCVESAPVDPDGGVSDDGGVAMDGGVGLDAGVDLDGGLLPTPDAASL